MLFTILFVGLSSCSNNDDDTVTDETSKKNIVETAQGTEALSSLVAALAKADEKEGTDLIGTLSGDGPFTVFAPTNDAFTALLSGLEGYDSLEDFDSDEEKALLTSILTYHVVGAKALSTDLSDGQQITTVQGEDVGISLEGGVFVQDATEVDAQVVQADVEASNGVVHVIDKVLVPQAVLDALNGETPMEELKTLTEIVVDTEALSVLEAAVIKAGLAETLSGDGPFTVFAPSDDAFIALLEVLGDGYNSLDDFDEEAEIDLLRNILLYHVIPARVKSTDLSEGFVDTAFEGNSIHVAASGDTFTIGDATDIDAKLLAVDIMASNGVAHTIDKVLLPQAALDFVASLNLMNIVELAVANNDLSLLVDALAQNDETLIETLSGEGPFTVFAPTNGAFVTLLDSLGDDYNSIADFDTDDEKDLLVKVLTYHVIADTSAFSTDLSDGQMIMTLQGEDVSIVLADGTVQIDDATDTNAKVVVADVKASNGVVHVIDKVLLPQEVLEALAPAEELNIVETAQSVDDLSLLVQALIQADAGLVETLSGDGPFTVFAPTNAAFTDLLEALGDDYNSLEDFDTDEEKDLLAKVLTYHVVADIAVASTDLSSHQEIVTVQGESVEALPGDTVQIRDKTDIKANVTLADVMASNGIVHVIDKVLLPQEVLDLLNPASH